MAGTSETANTAAGKSSIGEGSTGGSSWLNGGDGAGQPFAGESDGWSGGRSGSSAGATPSEMVGAPAGEVGAITGAVSSPPGPVSSVLVPQSDSTYAVIRYGGTSPSFALVQQGGGLSPAGNDKPSDSGSSWTQLAEGSPQLPCVYSLPLDVVSALGGMMQFCG